MHLQKRVQFPAGPTTRGKGARKAAVAGSDKENASGAGSGSGSESGQSKAAAASSDASDAEGGNAESEADSEAPFSPAHAVQSAKGRRVGSEAALEGPAAQQKGRISKRLRSAAAAEEDTDTAPAEGQESPGDDSGASVQEPPVAGAGKKAAARAGKKDAKAAAPALSRGSSIESDEGFCIDLQSDEDSDVVRLPLSASCTVKR